MILGSGSVLVGHGHPDVVAAVTAQVARGSNFSHLNPPAVHLAARLVEVLPCADKVRFFNSGSEAWVIAMRALRALTAGSGCSSSRVRSTAATTPRSSTPTSATRQPGPMSRPPPRIRPGRAPASGPICSSPRTTTWRPRGRSHAPIATSLQGSLSSRSCAASPPARVPGGPSRPGGRAPRPPRLRRGDHRVPAGPRRRAGALRRHAGPRGVRQGPRVRLPHRRPGGLRRGDVTARSGLAGRPARRREGSTLGNPISATAALATLDVLSRPGTYEHLHRLGGEIGDGLRERVRAPRDHHPADRRRPDHRVLRGGCAGPRLPLGDADGHAPQGDPRIGPATQRGPRRRWPLQHLAGARRCRARPVPGDRRTVLG